MKKFKVKYSFARLSTGELIEFSRSSMAKMNSNPHFLAPEVPFPEMATSTDQLETDYKISRKGGGKVATATTNASRIALETLLRRQSDYVNKVADGDESIILSSGFEPTKVPVPAIRPLFKVTNNGIPGQVKLTCKAVQGATAYVWQMFKGSVPADEKLWIFAGVSVQVKFVVENLDSISNYWFRVAPVIRSGVLNWSDPLMEVVT